MSDLPTHGLLQQLNAKDVSGEHLEVLGKKAAAAWCEGRVSTLNDAVVGVVKHAGLSPEQVKRVVEFTNTEAFLTGFKKEGANHKVVDFGADGPASPSAVLQDLNDGGGGSVFDSGTGDYHQPPAEKTALAEDDQALAAMFASSGESYPEHNPLSNTMELRDKLAQAYETATSELSTLENMFGDLRGQMFFHVKQACLGGHALSEVIEIWQQRAPSEEHVKVAFRAIADELVDNGVFFNHEELASSLQKVAQVGTVNEAHPLVSSFTDFCQVLSKLAEVRETQQETGEGLARVTAFLKEAAGKMDAIKRVAQEKGLLQAGVVGLDHAAHQAGDLAGRAAEHLHKGSGEDVNWLVHKGVKYVAPAVGVNEVYRRTLKHNPTFQGAKQTALSTIPGTQEYNQKELELQMRAQGFDPGMGY